jgi:SSS family solute:Na+ symporter
MVRAGDGFGIRSLVRLLVHGLSGGATRDGGKVHVGSPPHAFDRGRAKNVLSLPRNSAGHDRDRADAAYVATRFNNIMDMLQLVFAFVNAPLLATFLLGMFWKRTTGHGAFIGLLSGTTAAAIHQGLTLPFGALAGVKGGWFGVVHTYPSELAQAFWTAIFAWSACFVITILISVATRPRDDKDLVGLVYALTERPKEDRLPWYQRPAVLAVIVLLAAIALNIIFW